MRGAIDGGAGAAKSTLIRQRGDLYHNGSCGEDEKGVRDRRVLDGWTAPFGLTVDFGGLYAVNRRGAVEHDGPGKVTFFEGTRLTREDQMPGYRPHLRQSNHRETYQAAQPAA